MKYKGDGLNPPKNFKRLHELRSCNTCRFYVQDYPNWSTYTTCKRCFSILRKEGQMVHVEHCKSKLFVCDGWTKAEKP